MAIITVRGNSAEARQFLEFARTLPYVNVEEETLVLPKRSWAEASKNCITHEEFITELRRQVDEHFAKQNA